MTCSSRWRACPPIETRAVLSPGPLQPSRPKLLLTGHFFAFVCLPPAEARSVDTDLIHPDGHHYADDGDFYRADCWELLQT